MAETSLHGVRRGRVDKGCLPGRIGGYLLQVRLSLDKIEAHSPPQGCPLRPLRQPGNPSHRIIGSKSRKNVLRVPVVGIGSRSLNLDLGGRNSHLNPLFGN